MKLRCLVTALVAISTLAACTIARPPAAAAPPASSQAPAAQLTGDASRGQALFHNCAGCHRRDAVGRADGSYPRLAGQHASVLIKQLEDIRAGRRINHKMLPFADQDILGQQGIADVAAYMASLPIPADNGKGPGTALQQGRQLYERDCATCHGPLGEGDSAKAIPRLSGQHYAYLLREAAAIRDHARGNSNPDMVKVIGGYSQDQLMAVCDYASRLPVK